MTYLEDGYPGYLASFAKRPLVRLAALTEKYIEIPHKSAGKEVVTLGSSNGAIEVEAVGLDKIRAKLSRLDTLREVSLDQKDVSSPDPPDSIRKTCPGVCDFHGTLRSLCLCHSPLAQLFHGNMDQLNVPCTDDPLYSAGVRGLDLSKNLLPSWEVVALIVTELDHLERLALK